MWELIRPPERKIERMMYFETERLYTRSIEMEDLEDLHQMQSNNNIYEILLEQVKQRMKIQMSYFQIINSYNEHKTDRLIMAISEINNEMGH